MKKIIVVLLAGLLLIGCNVPAVNKKQVSKNIIKKEVIKKEIIKEDDTTKGNNKEGNDNKESTNKENTNKETIIKNSKDNKDYSSFKTVDIKLKNNKQILYITKEDIKSTEETNKPIKITLKINNSKVVFKSLWNDGVYVSIADFDNADKDMNIYITETGTDILCNTYIYKFDGKKIYEYDKIQHFSKDFLYDEKGNVYYWYNDDSKKEFNTHYNYKTKKLSNIMDNKLKTRLNSIYK